MVSRSVNAKRRVQTTHLAAEEEDQEEVEWVAGAFLAVVGLQIPLI